MKMKLASKLPMLIRSMSSLGKPAQTYMVNMVTVLVAHWQLYRIPLWQSFYLNVNISHYFWRTPYFSVNIFRDNFPRSIPIRIRTWCLGRERFMRDWSSFAAAQTEVAGNEIFLSTPRVRVDSTISDLCSSNTYYLSQIHNSRISSRRLLLVPRKSK